jgi:nicotinamidase-related amidase
MLLVMCPQNSYLDPQGSVYMGDKAEVLKVRLADYLSTYVGRRVFFREKRAERDTFFVNDKTHSVVNTSSYSVEDSLKKYADIYYDKTRHSGFFETGFEILLKKERVTEVTIVGLETHTSVLFTAEELRNRGIEVTVIEPLVASRDDYMHTAAISIMANHLGVRVG